MKRIVTTETMNDLVNSSISKEIQSVDLMYQAALGVFNSVKWKNRIIIICGKGNNAGDGFALATILKEHNYDVTVLLLENEFTKSGRYYFSKMIEKKVTYFLYSSNFQLDSYSIIVDAIFGTGYKGKVDSTVRNAIKKINESNKYVVSIDINSGLNGDNGLGTLIVKSNITISIGYLKYGLYLNMGKDYATNIINCPIDIIDNKEKSFLLEKDDVKKVLGKRMNFSNKGDYGYVGILGGCESYPGAVKLATLGQNALYAGCGVSRVIIPDCIKEIIYSNVLETTVFPLTSKNGFMYFDQEEIDNALKGLKALAIGIGWGVSSQNQEILKYILLNYKLPVIIDADGINNLCQIGLDILNKTKCKVILTPHLKEFSRMTNYTIKEIQENSIKITKNFVSKYDVTLLLKGPSTIICGQEEIYIVNSGCPGMAKAGSGDVLTGVLVGMLGYSKANLPLTIACGSYINGYAGQLAEKEYNDISMVSSDTARCVSKAIKQICK